MSPANARGERKAAAQARQQRADAAKPLRQEINRIDNKLGVLFAERDSLEAGLAQPDVEAAQLADSGRRLKAIGEQIETLEARWLELSAQIDGIAESVG
jgi:ATP-binding cassette subfamily F protein 3